MSVTGFTVVLFAAHGYGEHVLSRLCAEGHTAAIVFTMGEGTLSKAARACGASAFVDVDAGKSASAFEAIRACEPDLLVVVNGYDRTVSTHVARLARDAVYLHPSLLPRYRGPAPSNWALIEGESETGVTLSKLARQNDAGAILAQRRVRIESADTDGSLREKLALGICDLIARYCAVPRDERGMLSAVSDGAESTVFPGISSRDGHIRFDQSAAKIADRVRGVTPQPGAYTDIGEREVRITSVSLESSDVSRGVPGEILPSDARRGELLVRCSDGCVRVRLAEEYREGDERFAGRRTPFSADALTGGAAYDADAPSDEELTRYSEFPDMVVLAAAYPCNAHCPNCPYVPENSSIRMKYADAQFMDPKLFMKIADECGEAGRRGWLPGGVGSFVRITGGGEPMLHPYGMTTLVEYAMNAGARVYLNTNGSLLAANDIDRLLACGIDNIEVSVDAGDPQTYAIVRKGLNWEKLLETMRYMIARRNQTRAAATIEVSVINQAAAAGHIAQIEAFWYDLGVDNVIVRKFLTWGSSTAIDPNASADPSTYLDRDAGVPCPYPFQRLNIDSRGKVEVCGFDITGRTDMGNVRERSIRDVWRGALFSWWREKHRCGQGGDIPLCAECPDWKYRSWKHNYRKALGRARERRDAAIGSLS